MSYATGLTFVGHQELLDDFERFAARAREADLLAPVAERLHELIKARIQGRGQASDGSLIGGGRYRPATVRERRKSGRQTSFVDLTLSGAMLNLGFAWGGLPLGGFGLGFVDKLSADKISWLEKHFNQSIIAPSDAEQAEALAVLETTLTHALTY